MKNTGLIVERKPESYCAEVYRMLRANIQYLSRQKELKSILVTSAGHTEGKSTVACNLAVALAQSNKKTLLLDCDLQNPSVDSMLGLPSDIGLTDLLLGNPLDYWNTVIPYDKHLHIILSGAAAGKAINAFLPEQVKTLLEALSQDYDYIILDSPPVVTSADAQILASMADGVLLVAARGETTMDVLDKAKEMLQNIGANIVGIILNKAKCSTVTKYRKPERQKASNAEK